MKRVYRLENLDCPNCAAKMEREISKITGVSGVSVTFLTQKLTLDADENCFDDILREARKRVSKVDPECEIIAI